MFICILEHKKVIVSNDQEMAKPQIRGEKMFLRHRTPLRPVADLVTLN